MDRITIRNARPDDLDRCREIENLCFLPSEAASEERIQIRINNYPEGFFVALEADVIVGHINSGATNKDDISDEEFKGLTGHEPEGKNIVIFSLAVHPDYQGKGISGKLLHHFISESERMGKEKILLLCKDHLLKYYEKYGFKDNGLSASSHGGFEWHEMARNI